MATIFNKILFLSLFLVYPGIHLHSQQEEIAGITTRYKTSFSAPRDIIYTHFNKSFYLPGEDIWFASYVIDQTLGLPDKQATTLYAELYTPQGKLVEQKVLKISNGVAFNSFKICENCPVGSYTFRAYTNFMRNFQTGEAFNTTLKIAGNEKDSLLQHPGYDIQILPESGTLLNGVPNHIGIKAVDPNGKGIPLTGEIRDSQNRIKADFTLNHLGIGDFALVPDITNQYTATVMLPDGGVQVVDLPRTEEKGVVIKVNTMLKEKVAFEIVSNLKTILTDSVYYALVHNQGSIIRSCIINLGCQKQSAVFTIPETELNNGTNCITVFNTNFEPVAERLFFKYRKSVLGKLQIDKLEFKDSVEITLTSTDSLGNPFPASLSMSVLPEGTVSDSFSTGLYYEFLLKPGLNGLIEHPAYYFEKDDPGRKRDLDLLFLTQGWRKYDWKNILDENRKLPFEPDHYFSITGTVKSRNVSGKKTIMLMSPDNNLLLVEDTNEDGTFSFKGVALTDKTTVVLSASGKNGKPGDFTVESQIGPSHPVDSVIAVKPAFRLKEQPKQTEETIKLLPGEIMLEEVAVTAKRKRNPFEGTNYVPLFEKVYEITSENYYKYPDIEKLMRDEFNISDLTVLGKETKFGEDDNPNLYVDGIRRDPSFLNFYDVTQIEAVTYIKTPSEYLGPAVAVLILTRKKPVRDIQQPENIQYHPVKGYAPEVKYYTPRYLYPPETENYKKFATVFWKPDILTNAEGKATFKFSKPAGLKGIKLRTEGIAESGTLFLDRRLMVLDN